MLNPDRVLLVHPLGYRAEAASADISRIANVVPPLGLASIAAFLERRGIRATIVDGYARPGSDRALRDHLLAERPAFLGLSCSTSGFLDGIRIAEAARGGRLEELYRDFYRSHFKRPGVWMGYAAMLWRSPDSWLRFARNMGDFLKFARTNRRRLEEPG